jgi:hypothetical protein
MLGILLSRPATGLFAGPCECDVGRSSLKSLPSAALAIALSKVDGEKGAIRYWRYRRCWEDDTNASMAEVTRDSLVDWATESHNTARFHVVVIVSKP